MKKRGVVFVVAMIVACILGIAAYFAYVPPENPEDAARTPDGYIKTDAHYFGHDRIELNGKPLQNDPRVSVKDNYHPSGTDMTTLFGGATRIAGPHIVDFASLEPFEQKVPIEYRAISDTLGRVMRGETVNVLVGPQYAAGMKSYEDARTGAIDESRRTLDDFRNPIVYFERQGSNVTAVLVTINSIGQVSLDEGYKLWGEQLDHYANTPKGIVYVSPHRGQFLNDWQRYSEWTARRFDGQCAPDSISSRCLYKSHNNHFAFNGSDQVVIVGRVNVFGYNTQYSDAGDRMVNTQYTLTTNQGKQIVLGIGFGPDTHPSLAFTGRELLGGFRQNDGHVFSGDDLAKLPTFNGPS